MSSARRRNRRVVWVSLMGLFVIVCVIGRNAGMAWEVRKREQRIRDLVTVGMDIDNAIGILRRETIRVIDKYCPTETGDSWLTHVAVRDEHTLFDTLRYVTGINMGGGLKMWVTIRADKHGVITSIE